MQTSNAAKFNDGSFLPVNEKCEGCERIVEVGSSKFCDTYMNPDAKWRLGICNFATHVKVELKTDDAKVNPLKASKKAAGAKKKK